MQVVVGFCVDTECLNEIFGQDGWEVGTPLFGDDVLLYPLDADNYVMGVANYGGDTYIRRLLGRIEIGDSDLTLHESFGMYFADVSRDHPTIQDFELGPIKVYVLL